MSNEQWNIALLVEAGLVHPECKTIGNCASDRIQIALIKRALEAGYLIDSEPDKIIICEYGCVDGTEIEMPVTRFSGDTLREALMAWLKGATSE